MALSSRFILLPFPAIGHINPLLELARVISSVDHHTTLVISANLLNEGLLSQPDNPCISFFALNDTIDKALDQDISIAGVFDMVHKIQNAFTDQLDQLVTSYSYESQTANTRAVIIDVTCGHVPFLECRKRNILTYAFGPLSGSLSVEILKTSSSSPALPDDEFFKNLDPNCMIQSWKTHNLKLQEELLLSRGFLINSFSALEPDFYTKLSNHCSRFSGIDIRLIGPIMLPEPEENSKVNEKNDTVMKWLDKQKERSVVYISFGSIGALIREQLIEIYNALLKSGRPFLWSLRASQQELLPKDTRTCNQNKTSKGGDPRFLMVSWVPQKDILKHEAVRVFVSHCGWNSAFEGLSCGVPIIAWPMFGDQHGNAEIVVKSGCGVKLQNVAMNNEERSSKKEWKKTKLVQQYLKSNCSSRWWDYEWLTEKFHWCNVWWNE